MERVPENGTDCENIQDSLDKPSTLGKLIKKKKRGIIFLSTIPPYMNVAKVREIFSQYGEVGRIYLQPKGSMYFEVIQIIKLLQNALCNKFLNHCFLFVSRTRRETETGSKPIHRRLG